MHKIRLEKHVARASSTRRSRASSSGSSRAAWRSRQRTAASTQHMVMALERFLAKHVEMNHHARLVLFLRDKGIITQEEADAQLHPAIAGGYKTPSLPGPLGWAGMKRLASVQGAILGAMALAVAFVHASQIGAPPPVMAARPAAAEAARAS